MHKYCTTLFAAAALKIMTTMLMIKNLIVKVWGEK
jgi:hypothetical protein